MVNIEENIEHLLKCKKFDEKKVAKIEYFQMNQKCLKEYLESSKDFANTVKLA